MLALNVVWDATFRHPHSLHNHTVLSSLCTPAPVQTIHFTGTPFSTYPSDRLLLPLSLNKEGVLLGESFYDKVLPFSDVK